MSEPVPARSLPSQAFSSETLCEGLAAVDRQQVKEEYMDLFLEQEIEDT